MSGTCETCVYNPICDNYETDGCWHYKEEQVLCKDCKHSYTMMTARSKDGQERWTRFCDKHKNWYPKDDWFCKDGERKEE